MASLDLLTEDWADLAAWTAGAGASVAAGHLECDYTIPTNTGTVTSPATWDLTGASLAMPFLPPAEMTGVSNQLQQFILHTAATPATGGALVWEWDPDFGLRPQHWEEGAATLLGGIDVGDLPYSPVEHGWWRLRERDGLVTWDVSPDGIGWSVVAYWLPTFPVTALRVTLRSYWAAGVEAAPGPEPAVFGPLNMLPEQPADPATIIGQDGVPFLAVDVQPDNISGTFLLDDGSGTGSEVDGDDQLGWSATAAGSWENVVCDVTSVRVVRGATDLAGPLTTVDAGLLAITLSDTDRRFDPTVNADAIRPGTPVRVRAWGYDLAGDYWDGVLFTGLIDTDGLSVRYQPEGPPLVTISASDQVAEWAGWRSAGNSPTVGAGDDLLGRAHRLLAEMGQPASRLSQDVDVTGYAASHPAGPLAQPWEELSAAKDAELGRVWVTAANQLVIRTRRSELSGPVRGTLSDVHGDADAGTVHCCYRVLEPVLDPRQTVNRAIGTRRVETTPPDPLTYVVEDSASVGRWQPHVADRAQLELETDTQVLHWATDLVTLAGTPQLRVDAVAPHPSRDDLDSALDAWPAVCRTDLGDRWVARHHPEVGPTVDRTAGVLGVTHEITPEEWLVTFVTVDATPATPGNPWGVFILDDSDLDSGDVLAPESALLAGWGSW